MIYSNQNLRDDKSNIDDSSFLLVPKFLLFDLFI